MTGGIDAWNGLVSRAEVDQGIYLIEGDESPEEILSLAYGLEDGTYRFYSTLAEGSTEREVGQLFEKLAKAEINHKNNIWESYRALTAGRLTREAFETETVPKTMEGGKTPDQVLAEHPDSIQNSRDAIELAMSLETDALDLYLRMVQKTQKEEAKAVFFAIVTEEKSHLKRLGELFRKKLRAG
jgi:rubrerythrin